MVKLETLEHGDACRLAVHYDGHLVGETVIFSHMSVDRRGRAAGIFSPEGEPDMQSMMMLYEEEVNPIQQ